MISKLQWLIRQHKFAGAASVRCKLDDVDDDDDDGTMFHFRTQELELDQSSTEVTLTVHINDGTKVSWTDEVRIISSKKSKNTK